jgi:hypothetical protein
MKWLKSFALQLLNRFLGYYPVERSRDSVVVIETRLQAGRSGLRLSTGTRGFLFSKNVQTPLFPFNGFSAGLKEDEA